MKKGLTELVFILDRSGSMGGLESDTIGGFNGMIKKQQKEEGEANVTTVLFDDQIETIHDRFPLEIVKPLTEEDYYVRGCTALLDAVGSAIKHIGNVHKYARREDVPEKTIFVIITDGMENASHKYTYGRLQELIKRQKEKYGWEFLFLGANIDAPREAKRFGIEEERAMTYKNDSKGLQNNYQVLSETMECLRSCCAMEEFDAAVGVMRNKIADDVQKRGK